MNVQSTVTRSRFVLWCAGVLLAIAGNAAAQCPPDAQYLRPVAWPHPWELYSMATGDLDLDGRDEIVVRGFGQSEILIFPGTVDGGVGDPIPLIATGAEFRLMVADVMGDARPEIIAFGGTRIRVLTLPADAEPWAYTGYETILSVGVHGVQVANLNQDPAVDLVVSVSGTGSERGMRSYLGNGFGGFVLADELLDPDRLPSPAALHDINGDGHIDVLATTSPDDAAGLMVYHGAGDGTFLAPQEITPPAEILGAVVADARGDGTTEVALASWTTDLIEFWSIDTTGAATLLNTVDVGTRPRDLSIADADGDGHSDLLVLAEYSDYATVLYGTSTGAYEPMRLPVADLTGGIHPRRRGPEGGHDLVLAMATVRELIILEGRAGERAGWNRAYPCGDYSFIGGSADLTADGVPDLAVHALADAALVILENDGDGRFEHYATYDAPPLTAAIVVDDLNEDGHADVVMGSREDAHLEFRPGRPRGGLGDSVEISSAFVLSALASGDFTGDGHLDLVLQDHATWRFVVLVGDGAGGFTSGPQSLPVDSRATRINVVDLNHDDVLDLVVQGEFANDAIQVLLGAGGGAFQHPMVMPSLGGAAHAVFHDFNDDGHIDCATGRDSGSRVIISTGDGTGTLTWDHTIDLDIGVIKGLMLRDLNGDGREDLAVVGAVYRAGAFVTLTRTSDGTFDVSPPSRLAAEPTAFMMNDFNGDGAADFAVAASDGDHVTVLLGQCHVCRGDLDVSFSIGMPDVLLLLQAWGPCGPACAADLDGDGDVGLSDLFTILSAWGPCAFDPF